MLKLVVATCLFIAVLFSNSIFSQNVKDSINSLPETEKAEAALKMTKQYYTSNFDLADEYSTIALKVATNLNQKKQMGLAHKYLGITDYFRRDFDAAHIHYNRSLRIFEETKDLLNQSNVLNNIAILYTEDGDFQTSIKYNEKALKIREELGDLLGVTKSFNNIGNLYAYQNKYKEALEYYNKALKINKQNFPEKQTAKLITSIAKCYNNLGNTIKALDYFLEADDIAEKDGDIQELILVKTSFGIYYETIGAIAKAISTLSDALELATENNMDYYIGVLRLNIGNIYFQSEQYHKAADFYSSALPTYIETKDVSGQIRCLVNIGLTFEELSLKDSALSNYQQARRLAEKHADSTDLAMTANYLGRYYLDNSNYTKSIFWLEEASRIATINNIVTEKYKANYNIGLYWYELENYKKAIEFLKKASIGAKEYGDVENQKHINEVLVYCYENLNEYQLALTVFKGYEMLKDSIFNEVKQKQIRNIEGKLNLQLKESHIESQEQIISQQVKILEQEKRNKIYIIVVAFLVLGLLVIIYSREKIRRQKERAILVYEKKLLKTEMEKKELHKKELESELEYKSRQMTTHTLNMMQKNKALREMTVDISNISKKADDNIKQDLKRLKFQLNQSLKADKDWDEFRMYFEEVNQTFFSNLKEISPTISPSEERLAALIKLKMNIKETASVLNISPSSVKMARHRLRQKLNLPQDIDLYDFIGGI